MKSKNSKILTKLIHFIDKSGIDPLGNSPASLEIASFARRESIETAFSQASQTLIAATDYFEALDILIQKEKYAVAPWACARGLIESSALCTWLFEMDITSKERVSRSLSLRYNSLREQQKMARYDNDNLLIAKIDERIDSIEKIAIDLGYEILRNKKNRRIGIGQIKPSITDLVEKQFSNEILYRLLSGMAHSNYTTLTALSFTKANSTKKSGAVIQRSVPTDIQLSLLSQAGKIYAKCLWLKTIQFGFDAAEMAILLEEFYDVLEIENSNQDRFWRTIKGRGF
ncbi:MAG: DUF5677 domain-containing protein [Desulfobacula sp.]|uniref:DUF5677 domain-containing protein n=1 Tax=Desulfobacula sp. TaxID=2593537 RepID=UPI0025BCF0CC|nr:DUF5677 domain-containing protein [Desulfobacula sp.]MCD4722201.1 DUF5677 domain-containing protein [Desulfobacula sp.]